MAPRPLVDDSYMFQRIRVHDAESGEQLAALENPGKLGPFAFSPDGGHLAMIGKKHRQLVVQVDTVVTAGAGTGHRIITALCRAEKML